MSIHVLKRKMNEKTKLTKQNQYASSRGEPFALNVTNRGSIRSNLGSSLKKDVTVIMTGCCGGNQVRKPAISQSYFNYHRRSLGGLGKLAARVVTVRSPTVNGSSTAVNGSTHQMVTYKRAPEVGQSQYVKDKKSKIVQCYHNEVQCDPNTKKDKPYGSSFLQSYLVPPCHNNCGKGNMTTTKNLGFMSSSEHLQKKLSYRKKKDGPEEKLMNNGSCTVIE